MILSVFSVDSYDDDLPEPYVEIYSTVDDDAACTNTFTNKLVCNNDSDILACSFRLPHLNSELETAELGETIDLFESKPVVFISCR